MKTRLQSTDIIENPAKVAPLVPVASAMKKIPLYPPNVHIISIAILRNWSKWL